MLWVCKNLCGRVCPDQSIMKVDIVSAPCLPRSACYQIDVLPIGATRFRTRTRFRTHARPPSPNCSCARRRCASRDAPRALAPNSASKRARKSSPVFPTAMRSASVFQRNPTESTRIDEINSDWSIRYSLTRGTPRSVIANYWPSHSV